MYFAMSHTAFKNLIFAFMFEHKYQYENKVKFAKKYGYNISKPFEAKDIIKAREKAKDLL